MALPHNSSIPKRAQAPWRSNLVIPQSPNWPDRLVFIMGATIAPGRGGKASARTAIRGAANGFAAFFHRWRA
jgi:hypothetical protein